MPVSEAALAGMAANGHRWRYEIGLADLSKRIGRDGGTMDEAELSAVISKIVAVLRGFVARCGPNNAHMRYDLEDSADTLEEVAPEITEVRSELNRLYDSLDYYRIVAV